jgi:hypothetical protein
VNTAVGYKFFSSLSKGGEEEKENGIRKPYIV